MFHAGIQLVANDESRHKGWLVTQDMHTNPNIKPYDFTGLCVHIYNSVR